MGEGLQARPCRAGWVFGCLAKKNKRKYFYLFLPVFYFLARPSVSGSGLETLTH